MQTYHYHAHTCTHTVCTCILCARNTHTHWRSLYISLFTSSITLSSVPDVFHCSTLLWVCLTLSADMSHTIKHIRLKRDICVKQRSSTFHIYTAVYRRHTANASQTRVVRKKVYEASAAKMSHKLSRGDSNGFSLMWFYTLDIFEVSITTTNPVEVLSIMLFQALSRKLSLLLWIIHVSIGCFSWNDFPQNNKSNWKSDCEVCWQECTIHYPQWRRRRFWNKTEGLHRSEPPSSHNFQSLDTLLI